jgi:hypothetical protein
MSNAAEEILEDLDDKLLGMSDEELMAMPFPDGNSLAEVQEAPEEEVAQAEPQESTTEQEEDDEGEDETLEAADDSLDGESNEPAAESDPHRDDPGGNSPAKPKPAKDTSTDPADTSVDYKAKYEELLAPFKANGRDMQVGNVGDARHLMQMGANYNKKMAGLKPNLKYLKMLENNKLLDESKLNYLIELDKKNPDAVAKLIKDSGIDPLDVDTERATGYTPKSHSVTDGEVELDDVLKEIKGSASYADTIDIVSNKWDETSKRVLIENPSIIRVINDQVASGIYGKINYVMEQERMLGRLAGLSDLQAYKHVGDALQAQGAFDQEPTPGANGMQNKQAKKKDDAELANRKKAAGTTKSTQGKGGKKSFDPLKMDDADFAKLDMSSFS